MWGEDDTAPRVTLCGNSSLAPDGWCSAPSYQTLHQIRKESKEQGPGWEFTPTSSSSEASASQSSKAPLHKLTTSLRLFPRTTGNVLIIKRRLVVIYTDSMGEGEIVSKSYFSLATKNAITPKITCYIDLTVKFLRHSLPARGC